MSKHLPIILPPQKLEAILDGRATQFRVPLDPQPAMHLTNFYPPSPNRKGFEFYVYGSSSEPTDIRKYPEVHCPYGKPHDLLYVQEAWSTIGATSQDLILKATTHPGLFTDRNKEKPWQPPATMPKKVARLWLKVTQVRIHRVKGISQTDALAEGPTPLPKHNVPGFAPAYKNYQLPDNDSYVLGPRVAFQQWFISAYGRDLYDADAWLWAVTFQRINSPLALLRQPV